jgi:PadR family transcriptional regulator PadR
LVVQGIWYYLHEEGRSLRVGIDNDSRVSQLRRGALELAIMALLARGELYGAEIVDRLAATDGLQASAGTVYPLLARLRKAGALDSSWRESPVGPPRKYYRLSRAGRSELATLAKVWRDLAQTIAVLLEEADTGA